MSGITPGQTYSPKTTTAGRKDAFHVCAVLCRSDETSKYRIDPGERVKLSAEATARWYDDDEGDWDGIADPFAPEIGKESLFWVFLRPERAKDLTHSFRVELPESDEEPLPVGDVWDAGCRKCDS